MEFVGKTVKKAFKGFGVFSGTVRSYDASSGIFEIAYEDGDCEDLELSEVASLLEGKEEAGGGGGELAHAKPRVGRKPKKRRRTERKLEIRGRSGNVSVSLVTDGKDLNENCDLNNGFGGNLRESVGIGENSNGNCNSNDGFERILEMGHGFGGNLREIAEINRNLNIDVEKTLEKESGFDLNTGFNLNEEVDLNDGCDAQVKSEENLRKKDSIDLNLDVNGDFDENLDGGDLGCLDSGTEKRKCDFDLNVEVYEEIKDTDGDGGVEFKGTNSSEMIEESQKKEIGGDVEEKCEEDGGSNGSLEKVNLDINDVVLTQGISGSSGSAVRDASLGLAEGPEKENSVCSGDLKAGASLGVLDDTCIKDSSSMEVQLKDGRSEAGTIVIHGDQGDLGSPCKQGSSRRKRRRLSDNLRSTTETVLRRSARRGAAQSHVSMMSCAVNDPLLSPAVSAVTEEMGAGSGCEGSKKTRVLPSKLQFPPSSQNLNLDEIPVLDLFAVYACLRSFSTLLFLSPFELEDFVAELRYKSPSRLFDCIHVSILQTLRKHLEYLSSEGSESASNCLRYPFLPPSYYFFLK
jgi:hypothetical protein